MAGLCNKEGAHVTELVSSSSPLLPCFDPLVKELGPQQSQAGLASHLKFFQGQQLKGYKSV